MMLDEIMRLAGDQSVKGYEMLDSVSKNMANYNVYGYKAQRFEQFIRPDGSIDRVRRVDYTPGELTLTKRELDVGIEGAGFIQVTRADGSTAYTRNGSFAKNAEGYIVTNHGDLVGTGIKIPASYEALLITPEGTVQIVDKKAGKPVDIGHITLVNFNNPEGLKEIGNSMVLETPESGEPLKMENHNAIAQGRLEHSNVNLHYAVEDILRINAQVISNTKILKLADEIYKQAIQLRQ